MTSYPTPKFRRTAFPPAVLAAIVLFVGAALVGTEGFTWIEFGVSILALIVCVFAWQARHWWWIIPLGAIAVLWNPILPFGFEGVVWQAAHFAAALVFIAAGAMIRVRNDEDRNVRPTSSSRR